MALFYFQWKLKKRKLSLSGTFSEEFKRSPVVKFSSATTDSWFLLGGRFLDA